MIACSVLAGWADPPAPKELNNPRDLSEYISGKDPSAQFEQNGKRYTLVKKGDKILLRVVEEQELTVHDARLRVLTALAARGDLDRVRGRKEFNNFLLDKGKGQAALYMPAQDAASAVLDKDGAFLFAAGTSGWKGQTTIEKGAAVYDTACATSCRTNLKNLATTLEMYSTDNQGRYPLKLESLTPRYLRNLPQCPGAEKMSYTYQVSNRPDGFTLTCSGENHAGIHPANFPQYSNAEGLINR